jgi:hypothetical protein
MTRLLTIFRSSSIMKKSHLIAAAAGFIAIIALLIFFTRDSGVSRTSPASGDGAKHESLWGNFFGSTSYFKEDLDLKKILSEDPEIESILGLMKEKYGKKLSNKRVQVKLLGGLIRYLKKKNPYDWKERIRVIVQAEYPEYAVELSDKLEKLAEYDDFLKDSRGELQSMGNDERKAKMLEKRREIFGDECDEIWEREISDGKISEMLTRLDRDADTSLNGKLAAYNGFTKTLYTRESDVSSGKTDDEVLVRNYDLTKKFFEMQSVQADLNGMDPGERARFLKRARESMGLGPDVVRKMEEIDALQDDLWKQGARYNEERYEIVSRYDGEERTRKLDEARKRYFGEHSDLIKYEEETFNFCRFQYPRRWGMD